MPDLFRAAIVIGVVSLVTILLRFLPFWVFSGHRPIPKVIQYLGQVLPYAVMAMLVVYCLKGTSFGRMSSWVPSILSVGAVVALHVWKRNTLLSIIGGTACYMLLIRLMG